MVETDDAVVEEVVREGEALGLGDLFDLLERAHDAGAGVPRAAVTAYARELASRRDYEFDADEFLGIVDDRATDAESWAGPDRFYALADDRLSQYPARWHDRLGGSTDPAEYVRFIQAEAPEFLDDLDHARRGAGVPEDALVELLQVVGRADRETATAAIAAARERGTVREDADQHPQAGVYLADEDEGREE